MSRAMLLCVLASTAHASLLDGNYADEQAQRRLTYERVYTFHPELKSWHNAREYCSSIGGNLATAHSEAENDMIFGVRGTNDAWIGLTDQIEYSTEGFWVWEDGSQTDYLNWATYEPNDASDNEDCAIILGNKKWSDIDCGLNFEEGEGHPFICQVDITYTPTRKPTPAPPPEPTRKPTPAPNQDPTQLPTNPESIPEPILMPSAQAATCFHADGLVSLESGQRIPLAKVAVGDRILSSDEYGNFSFFSVVHLPHKKNNELVTFLELHTEKGKVLTLTLDHLLPRCSGQVVPAREMLEGDCVLTVHGPEALQRVKPVEKAGVYTAITENKFIVVDHVIASSFGQDRDTEREFQRETRRVERQRGRKLLRRQN